MENTTLNHNEFYEKYGDFSNIVHDETGEPTIHIPLEDQYQVMKERFQAELRDDIIQGIVDKIIQTGGAGKLYEAIKAKLVAEGFYQAPVRYILHRYSKRVLFKARAIDQVDLVRKAVEADAFLKYANLSGLDLSAIDLRGVNTSTWNLEGSKLPEYL